MIFSICTAAFLILFIFYILKKDNKSASIYFGLFVFSILCFLFGFFSSYSSSNGNLLKRFCTFFVSAVIGVIGTKYFFSFIKVFTYVIIYFKNLSKKTFFLFKKLEKYLYGKRIYAILFIGIITGLLGYFLIDKLYSFNFLSQHPKILKLLVDCNFKVEKIEDEYETSFLVLAIRQNDAEIVKMILNNDNDLHEALYEAIRCKNAEIVEILLASGAKIDEESANEAWIYYDENVFKILIKCGLDLNLLYLSRSDQSCEEIENQNPFSCRSYNAICLYKPKCTFLHAAIVEKKLERVKALIKLGANIDLKDERGCSPLWLACRIGYTEGAKFLIQNGADVNLEDNDGYSPLMLSVYQKYDAITKFLIYYGAKTDVIDKKGRRLLHFAVEADSRYLWYEGKYISQIIELLLAQNVDITSMLDAKDNFGNTPLHVAICNGNYEGAGLLISNGANVNIINDNNEYPLTIAIRRFYNYSNSSEKWINNDEYRYFKFKYLIELLIKNSNTEVINFRNSDGKTCLHFAVEINDISLVTSLLNKGCDINIKDNFNYTALHYVQSTKIKQLFENLKNK